MSLITRATKVTLDDHGALTLRPTDYITQGGEGAIYRNGQYIIKLYLDAQKMQQDDMVKKVRLLATSLKHSSIVAPQGIVSDTGGKPIGYYMPFVSGEAYPRIFTNDWRTQNNFNLQSTICLTAKMHEVVAYAHDQKALMVDANELNWIADVSNASDPVPYVIDVDSWQIERFKASVIMPSIRDWHSVINEASDWFAWGVVTFLLYTGIHPYRGKLDGYKPGEMERRMKNNASVFLPEVKLNKAVRDFRTIPGPLLDWYKAVFTDGERSIPPSPLQVGQARTAVGRILRTVTTATGGLIYEKLFELLGDEVKSVWPCGIMRMNSGSLINLSTKREIGQVSGSRVAVTSHNSGWLVVEEIGGDWHWRNIDQKGLETKLSVPLEINSVVRSNERLFVANDTELVEMSLHQFSKPVLTIGKRWQILGKSTKWFQGVGVSDIMGAMHLIAPYGDDAVAMVRTPELDGIKAINAIAGNRFVEVITINPKGEYEAKSFSFDSDWRKYDCSVRIFDGPEQNLSALPKGVTASIAQDGELVITVPSRGEQKIVSDKDLATDMRLTRIGNQVTYLKDGALWSLRMQ